MPLYLCQPGTGQPEPWRHGLHVYMKPFQREEDDDDENAVDERRSLRRLRHGEIVLVDDVCLAWDRYWLRLRWPGHRGGFAGYLPLDKSISSSSDAKDSANEQDKDETDGECL